MRYVTLILINGTQTMQSIVPSFKYRYCTGCGKKYPPEIFRSFLSHRLEFRSEILRTYL